MPRSGASAWCAWLSAVGRREGRLAFWAKLWGAVRAWAGRGFFGVCAAGVVAPEGAAANGLAGAAEGGGGAVGAELGHVGGGLQGRAADAAGNGGAAQNRRNRLVRRRGAGGELRRSARRRRASPVLAAADPVDAGTGLSLPIGPKLSAGDKAEAIRKFGVVEPLISPGKFVALWAGCGGLKMAVMDLLAGQHQVSRNTLYRWLKSYKTSGLQGLAGRPERSDKGRARNGAGVRAARGRGKGRVKTAFRGPEASLSHGSFGGENGLKRNGVSDKLV